MICGDHICINKAEANQYFEDNLSIEVKIVEKKSNKIDKNFIEKIIEFRETRFSKYCTGMNYLLKSI